MRAVVTGGAGFIGSSLVDGLVAAGHDVHVVDTLVTGKRENLTGALARGAQLHVVDVAEPAAVAEVFAGARPHVVFHLAAQIDVRKSVDDPAFDARINVAGTAAVLEAARRARARRVLLASTTAVYGDPAALPTAETSPVAPLAPYGAGKAAGETYLAAFGRLYGLSTVSLRLANVYGPRQDPHSGAGVVAIFCGAAAEGRAVQIFGDGRQTRDYVFVGDVVEAFLAAADADVTGPLNIGSGLETDLLTLARELGLVTEFAPARTGEIQRSCLDPAAARAALGWRARTSLRDGLAVTLAAVSR